MKKLLAWMKENDEIVSELSAKLPDELNELANQYEQSLRAFVKAESDAAHERATKLFPDMEKYFSHANGGSVYYNIGAEADIMYDSIDRSWHICKFGLLSIPHKTLGQVLSVVRLLPLQTYP